MIQKRCNASAGRFLEHDMSTEARHEYCGSGVQSRQGAENIPLEFICGRLRPPGPVRDIWSRFSICGVAVNLSFGSSEAKTLFDTSVRKQTTQRSRVR